MNDHIYTTFKKELVASKTRLINSVRGKSDTILTIEKVKQQIEKDHKNIDELRSGTVKNKVRYNL